MPLSNKISQKTLLRSCLLFLKYAISRCANILVPKTANIVKYVTTDVVKLYIPIPAAPNVLDKCGVIIKGTHIVKS